MFVIGITGGIGCGKSTAAAICQKAGLPVIDADSLSRKVTAADGPAIPAIKEVFGSGVIDEKGALDRTAMAKKVFRNRSDLDKLSKIVHQFVIEQMRKEVDRLARQKVKAAVLDVPIPVKQGFMDICDQVWVIWANEENRIERLRARGMSEEEAARRMNIQMSKDEYVELADHVLDNDEDIASLEKNVLSLLEKELGDRGIRLDKAGGSDVEPE